jgi:hypothetical protein
VWARFAAYAQTVSPEHIATLELDALAACGLSRRKAEYLVDLAGHFIDGRVPHAPIRSASSTTKNANTTRSIAWSTPPACAINVTLVSKPTSTPAKRITPNTAR